MCEGFYTNIGKHIARLINPVAVGYIIDHENTFIAALIANDITSPLLIPTAEKPNGFYFHANVSGLALKLISACPFNHVEYNHQYYTLNPDCIREVKIPQSVVYRISNAAMPPIGTIWFIGESFLHKTMIESPRSHGLSQRISFPNDWFVNRIPK